MPLTKSRSKKARNRNIRQLIHDGFPIKQAVAIGYSIQRSARRKTRRRKKRG